MIKKDKIREHVRNRYAEVANSNNSCGSTCCSTKLPDHLEEISEKLGYSEEEIKAVPEGANMGLGCGNPQVIAGIMEGETVLDLGSGGGFDCFLASRQAGQSGRVIGVDMTPDMVSKARENANKGGYENVEFRLGEIEHLPVADNSIDVIISNCVLNLSPDKPQVYREAGRVLRTGGRIALSDVVALKPLPAEIAENLEQYGGCVSGAALVSDIEQMLNDAGFTDIRIEVKPESRDFIVDWFPESKAEDYVASATIKAVKKDINNQKIMDVKTKEMIAIGASVAAHCQPCLSFHVGKAKEFGTGNEEISTAMEVGRMVQKGAMLAINKFAKDLLDGSEKQNSDNCGCGS